MYALGVFAVLAACDLLVNQLLVGPMIDLHGHKVGIKQATKKEPRDGNATHPRKNAPLIEYPRHTQYAGHG